MPLTIPTEPITVVLDPARWVRGTGSGSSYLLDAEGGMCCWGFACLALGASKDEIAHESTVYTAFGDAPLRLDLADQYEINDGVGFAHDVDRVRELNRNAEARKLPVRFVLKEA